MNKYLNLISLYLLPFLTVFLILFLYKESYGKDIDSFFEKLSLLLTLSFLFFTYLMYKVFLFLSDTKINKFLKFIIIPIFVEICIILFSIFMFFLDQMI